MKDFNKYTFLNELEEEIKDFTDYEEAQEYIMQELERVTIYTHDCYAIIAELGLTCFSDFELGTARNISELAYFGLYEYTFNNIEINIEY